ncbi:MAG: general secretion pathway protein GspK [Candidatus Omnitrophica bacterium]|nr:general secretion pathway protein GspK [Candidatus Omnitrophota bacterium]
MRKATVLIFALGLLTLLSLICLEMGLKRMVEVKKARLFLNKTRASLLALSGINCAKNLFLSGNVGDGLQFEVVYNFPYREGSLKLFVEDESSRIDLNFASDEVLENLFNSVGLGEKLDYVLDYIDQDSSRRRFDSEQNAKNGSLDFTEELLLINEISASDYSRIKDFITVFNGDEMINVNTAKEEVLEAVVGSLLAAKILSAKESAGYNNSEWQNLLDGLSAAQQKVLRENCKIDYGHLRINSRAEIAKADKNILCVIDQNQKVRYWHEE